MWQIRQLTSRRRATSAWRSETTQSEASFKVRDKVYGTVYKVDENGAYVKIEAKPVASSRWPIAPSASSRR